MAKKRMRLPSRVRRGQRMRKGKGWRLVGPGRGVGFKAALVTSFNGGDSRFALFRILPGPVSP